MKSGSEKCILTLLEDLIRLEAFAKIVFEEKEGGAIITPLAGVEAMHTDLIKMGDILRTRRKEKNLSLKEVENATSIRMSYLESIEEGHLGKLISPIYAQGFIKKYATYLDLDGEKLIREHPYVMKVLSEKTTEKQDFSLGIGTLEVRGTPANEVKWLPNLMWVAISAGAILVGWFLLRAFGIF